MRLGKPSKTEMEYAFSLLGYGVGVITSWWLGIFAAAFFGVVGTVGLIYKYIARHKTNDEAKGMPKVRGRRERKSRRPSGRKNRGD